ncbi:MAG: riboflavin synthase [Dehalococcoidales bacterium]|nr:riboflavin synthase [Dehalococcoidales bacterium]
MFTGIIDELGRVSSTRANRLTVSVTKVTTGMETGGSIAVNGVCLTMTDLNSNSFSVDLMPETLRLTNLGGLSSGDRVNLERPLTLQRLLGGHLVQGHIDALGRVTSLTQDGDAIVMGFDAPPEVMRYVVTKGFIAVDGVSLTVVARDASSFRVSIVGSTAEHTTLGNRRVGDMVNLEADIIAKYVEQLSQTQKPGVTVEFLQEHGFTVG